MKKRSFDQAAQMLMRGETIADIKGISAEELEELYSMGFAQYNQGKYLEASFIFTYLAIHNYKSFKYNFALASSLQMSKKHNDALRYYLIASALDITTPIPTFHAAECFIALNRHDEAKKLLLVVIEQCDLKIEDQLAINLKKKAELVLSKIMSK